eukprot:15107033-Heterocapsa_arctica.AAC.1
MERPEGFGSNSSRRCSRRRLEAMGRVLAKEDGKAQESTKRGRVLGEDRKGPQAPLTDHTSRTES